MSKRHLRYFKLLTLHYLQLCFVHSVGSDFSSCITTGQVISDVFCLPSNYRKEVPPKTNGPLNVFFKLPITEVSSVDDHTREITLRLGYNMRWPEHRMVLNESADWSRGEINVRPDMIQHFWVPDIGIHDLVRFTKPEVLLEVAALEIISDHSLYYKIRSEVTLVCRGMVFSHYPLDQHVCHFTLSSYGYDQHQMKINGQFSYDRASQRDLQFHTDIKEIDLSKRVWHGEEKNYSMYGVEILLSRTISPFLVSVYLPSTLLVIISWVSFFVTVMLARTGILVSTSLLLLNMLNNTRSSVPISNSATALEIWLLTCLMMMFFTIIQFLFIIKNTEPAKTKTRPMRIHDHPKITMVDDFPQNDHEKEVTRHSSLNEDIFHSNSSSTDSITRMDSFGERIQLVSNPNQTEHPEPSLEHLDTSSITILNTKQAQLDRDSRFLFPLIFTSLTSIYWIYFLHLAQ